METRTRARDGQHLDAVIVGSAGAVVVVGSFMPWLRSGTRGRSSFDLVAVATRLGLSPDGWQGVLMRLWPVVPLGCVLATVAVWWGRHAIGAALAAAVGAGALWLSWRVRAADVSANLRIAAGPTITLIGACALVLAAARAGWRARRV